MVSCRGVLSSECLMSRELLVCSSWVSPGRLRHSAVVACVGLYHSHALPALGIGGFFLCTAFLERLVLDC